MSRMIELKCLAADPVPCLQTFVGGSERATAVQALAHLDTVHVHDGGGPSWGLSWRDEYGEHNIGEVYPTNRERTERNRTMAEHNHITHGDIIGCPACDKRERRLPAPEPMPPAPTSPDLSLFPEVRHRIEGGRFICPGDENARCHRYPGDDCDHEYWPCGHEYVGHVGCWVKAWVDGVNLSDSYDGGLIDMPIPDAEFPDGDVIWNWEGDYVTFDYAAEQGEAENHG